MFYGLKIIFCVNLSFLIFQRCSRTCKLKITFQQACLVWSLILALVYSNLPLYSMCFVLRITLMPTSFIS